MDCRVTGVRFVQVYDAGTDLVELFTGLVFHGPFLPAHLTRVAGRRPTTRCG